jgi:hypothetical protein
VVLFVLAEGFKDPFASLIVNSGDGLQVSVTDPDFILDSRFNSFFDIHLMSFCLYPPIILFMILFNISHKWPKSIKKEVPGELPLFTDG